MPFSSIINCLQIKFTIIPWLEMSDSNWQFNSWIFLFNLIMMTLSLKNTELIAIIWKMSKGKGGFFCNQIISVFQSIVHAVYRFQQK